MDFSKFTDMFSGMSSGSGNPIERIINKIETALLFLIGKLGLLSKFYAESTVVLYVPRILFFLAMIILFIMSIFWTPDKFIMYHVYSLLKLIFVLLIAIGSLLVMADTSKLISEKGDANIPFPIISLASVLLMTPYFYDVVAIIIIMGAIKALYIQACDGANTNVYPFVGYMQNIFIIFAILSLILMFIAYKFKISLKSVVPLLAASMVFLVTIFVINGIENVIADNINYLVGAYKGEPPGKDCYDSNKDESESALTMVLNIIVSILLVILTLIVFALQIVVYPPNLIQVNRNVRTKLQEIIQKVVNVGFS